ncbi:MAG: chromosomal replication initiator protein DnaA [Acidobacteria bacterium]|nr:chromosomal replication initiator protein DnaA [Acidobacteriota bacterium]
MNVWSQVLERLREELTEDDFDKWFEPTEFLGEHADTVDVRVPDTRFVDQISQRWGPQIREILLDLNSETTRVHFVADAAPSDRFKSATGDLESSPRSSKAAPPQPVFNPRYTFDKFVVGGSNQLAYAASVSIAENPSGSFNPLFIYGGAGLGKTHLIQAIGHRILADRPDNRVVYMSADNFVTDLISSIRYDRMASFRERYRSVDALLLDDIQFLAGKERTQQEFFHTFNALYENQKQIVFTSDAPPREMPNLEDRLRSRFEWGLIADIQPPDLETKVAILRKKAEERGIPMPQQVALFVAERVRSNVRELEGHLNRIAAFASLTGHPIDLDLTKEALRDILAKENKPITPAEIIKVVASHYGLKVSDLKSKSNARPIAYPRQVAMYLCKQLTDLSYPEVGKLFGNKHHSTVIYSVEKIERLKSEDPSVESTVDMLTRHFR